MSEIPENLLYTKEHEWCRINGTRARIGITAHAASELGDVVFVELPEEGDELEQDKPFGTVESVKAVSDLFAPLSGSVVAVNETLAEAPETLNEDPYGEGWMIEIELSAPGEQDTLMSPEDYKALIEE